MGNYAHHKTFKAHKSKIFSVISTDEMLITAAKEKKVKFWINFNEEYQVEHRASISWLAVTDQKRLLFTADTNGVVICTNIHTRYSVKYDEFDDKTIVSMAAMEDMLVIMFRDHFIVINYVDYVDLDFYKYI